MNFWTREMITLLSLGGFFFFFFFFSFTFSLVLGGRFYVG